jgi:hypothetical protein
MDNIKVKANDKGYRINFTVQNDDASEKDLTDYAIKLKVWAVGSPETKLTDGTCVIDVALDGTCHYTVTATDFVTPGRYLAELELTKTGIIESTEEFAVIVEESA